MAKRNAAPQGEQAKATAKPSSKDPNAQRPVQPGVPVNDSTPDLTLNPKSDDSQGGVEKPNGIAGHWVRSKQDGFRRAGIAFSQTPTFFAFGELSAEQLDAIAAEPMLELKEGA